MTWNQLAQKILDLPEGEREEQANVLMRQTGEFAVIDELDKTDGWASPAPFFNTLIYER